MVFLAKLMQSLNIFYIFSYPNQKEMLWTDKNGRHIGWVRLLEIKDWKGKTKVNKTDLNCTQIAKTYDFFPFKTSRYISNSYPKDMCSLLMIQGR